MNKHLYPCAFCDTEHPQAEKLVTRTLQRNGRWYIFENVLARVCPNCGHRYFDGPLLLELEKLTQHPEKGREVPAYAFSLPLST